MFELKFDILDYLYHSPNHEKDEIAIFSRYLTKIDEVKIAIKDMTSGDRPLLAKVLGKDAYRMTAEGNNAYELEKERRDNEAKQEAEKQAEKLAEISLAEKQAKKQFRHDLIVAMIAAVASAALTLLIEHFPKIIDANLSLFK